MLEVVEIFEYIILVELISTFSVVLTIDVVECMKVNNVEFNKNDVLLLKLREDSLLFKVIGIPEKEVEILLLSKDNDAVVKEVEESMDKVVVVGIILEILTDLLDEKID